MNTVCVTKTLDEDHLTSFGKSLGSLILRKPVRLLAFRFDFLNSGIVPFLFVVRFINPGGTDGGGGREKNKTLDVTAER